MPPTCSPSWSCWTFPSTTPSTSPSYPRKRPGTRSGANATNSSTTAAVNTQTLYLDGAQVGTLDGVLTEQSQGYAYLGAGYASPSWMNLAASEYRFKGQMDEVAFYDHTLDPATITEHYAASTAIGQITKVTLPSGRVHATAAYNPVNGRLSQHSDENGGTWKVSAPAYSSASSSYADVIQRSGPTGYWRLGERGGAEAASPLGEDFAGSYLDGARLGSPGIFADSDDTAANFTGDSAIEVPVESLGTKTAMSLELWFKTSTRGVLVANQDTDFGDTPTAGWRPMMLVDSAGKLRGRFSAAATSLISQQAVNDDKWHHVLLTGNEGIQALFVDGEYQSSTATGVGTSRYPHVFVGGGYSSTGWDGQDAGYRNFTGQIDEVAFYDKALVSFVQKSGAWSYSAAAAGQTDVPTQHIQARRSLVTGRGEQYDGVAVADAPAAYWRLGEAQGTALSSEAGGTGRSATFRPDTGNASKLDQTGVFGAGDNRAVKLSGGGTVEIPGSILAGATDMSAEMWFRTATSSAVLMGFQDVPVGQTPTSWRPLLNIDGSGKLRGQFYTSGGATPIVSAQTVTDNEWHHVALSGSGSTQTLYLDGVKVGSLSGTIVDQARTYAYLGGGYGTSGWMGLASNTYYLNGQLDEVALYRSPLTADQVSAHYRAQAEAADSGLTSTVTVTDPAERTSTTSYDALRGQRVVARKDPLGALTSYAYDTVGNLHTVTDPNGHATVTGHDPRGNIVSTTTCRDADSCWTSFASYHLNPSDPLDPRNDKQLTYRDQRSTDFRDDRYRTAYGYNTQGLPTSTVRPDDSTTRTNYTAGTEAAVGGGTVPAGLVSSQVTFTGATTTNRYYANGDLAEVTSPSGLVTSYTYDGLGRQTSEKQVSDSFPSGVTTTYGYDNASRLVTETGAGVKNEITGTTHAAKISRSYDEDGNLLSEKTEDTTGGDTARNTLYHYNAHGLNDSVTDAEQHTTLFEHDAFGRLHAMTDPAANHFTHTYTARGQHATTVLEGWTGGPSGTVRDLTIVSNAYDPAGRLASTTDAMGATTAYTYYDDDLAAATTAKQVTQPDGTRRDIVLEASTYDPAGNLTRQVTGGGKTTQTFTMDSLGRTTTTVLDPGGLNRTSIFTYDADDRVKQQTQTITGDKKLTTSAEYDPAGNVTKQTVTDGTSTHTTTSTYDDRGLPLTTVSPRGNVPGADPAAYATVYRYDALGRLVQETAPTVQTEENGAAATASKPTTLTGYNTFGEAIDAKDPRGKVTRSQVDRLGRTTAVTLPDYTPPGSTTALSATTRTTYTPLGLPQTVTDPLGRVTSFGYDQFGQVINETDPAADALAAALAPDTDLTTESFASAGGGTVTAYTWTPTGLQLSVTDPIGARTEATYDELGRQLTTTTVERYPTTANLISRYTWDDASNQIASTTPSGITTSATYNPAGETSTITDPAGTTRYDYDGLGRQTETTDATNRRTTLAYDALDNVTATTDYGTGTTALRTGSAEFDSDGNQTASISAQTHARTTYAYDALGRMTTQIEPVSSTEAITTSFGYDAAGNQTRLTDGRGNKTLNTFNSWGLPESTIDPSTATHPGAADRTWTTIYDKAGQAVTELLPGGVKRERTYDGLGRLVTETGTGAEATTTARTLEYDLADRLTAASTADGTTRNTYTYNDRGELLTANGSGGDSNYSYNADGSMTYRKTTAGTVYYGYDGAGRIDWIQDSITGNQIWYDFDAAGRPRLEQYAAKPAGATAYTATAKRVYGYDDLGRLTGDTVTNPAGTSTVASLTYGYDLDDNLTSKTTTGTAGAAANTYTYDQANRLKSWTKDATTTVAYEWDASGNRTKAGSTTATFDARNRQLTNGTTTYTYTARGTQASVAVASGSARALTFDAFERKITDGATSYTYDSLDRVQTRSTTTFTYDGGSNNLADDGTTSYNRTPDGALLSAATGTSKQWTLTDQHTDLIASLTPDATAITGSTAYDPFGAKTANTGTTSAVGYQSGWTDPTTGDVNMAARWYQPSTGSFASRDTWQLDASPSAQANRYGYANNTPLTGTDPTGHVCACGGGSSDSRWLTGAARGGKSSGAAPRGYVRQAPPKSTSRGRSTKSRPRSTGSGTASSRNIARAQARRNAAELRRIESRYNTRTTRTGSGTSKGRTTTYRGCSYNCGKTTTTYRGGYTRGNSGKGRTGTTTPTKPRIPQNPNRGKNPVPAPTRPPVPKPRVDTTAIKQRALNRAIVIDRQMFENMAVGGMASFEPDDLTTLDPALVEVGEGVNESDGSVEGPDRDRSNRCDTGAGFSPRGNIVYLPRREHAGQCVATGAFASLTQADYTPPPRPGLDFTLPGLRDLPTDNRARGHLIGFAMGGSNKDTRNFVPMFQSANDRMYKQGEDIVVKSIKAGGRQMVQVTPVYGDPNSVIPTKVRFLSFGSAEVRCEFDNNPQATYKCW
jgi:RHS repeat-associated protein